MGQFQLVHKVLSKRKLFLFLMQPKFAQTDRQTGRARTSGRACVEDKEAAQVRRNEIRNNETCGQMQSSISAAQAQLRVGQSLRERERDKSWRKKAGKEAGKAAQKWRNGLSAVNWDEMKFICWRRTGERETETNKKGGPVLSPLS